MPLVINKLRAEHARGCVLTPYNPNAEWWPELARLAQTRHTLILVKDSMIFPGPNGWEEGPWVPASGSDAGCRMAIWQICQEFRILAWDSEEEARFRTRVHDSQHGDTDDDDEEFKDARVSPTTQCRGSSSPLHAFTARTHGNAGLGYDPDNPTFAQAMRSPDWDAWIKAIADSEEIKAMRDNRAFHFRKRPRGRNIVKSKIILKVKRDQVGKIVKYKARWVARGFSQRHGEDYDETYAPVVKKRVLQILKVIAQHRGLLVRQLDVKTAFLRATLDEEIYMDLPPGLEEINADLRA
jgi:hypothetical protein